MLRQSFKVFPRRRRIRELEAAVLDNPSAGNYEELADLYMEEGNFSKARDCYDKAISSRTDSPDPFYRRGVCEIELGDFTAAVQDLERVVQKDLGYDFHRAKGLLAHAYANSGQPRRPKICFARQSRSPRFPKPITTTRYFSRHRTGQPKPVNGRRRSSPRKPTMPGYLRRRERPWFRKASAFLKRLKAVASCFVRPEC